MKSTERTKRLVIASLIIAIIALMGFTPLGYIKIGPIEVTFLMIPVVIGASVLGIRWGTLFGAIFGITSFIQCFGYSPFGTALFAINPFYTFLLCVVPRTLMGLLAGLIFKAISKIDKTKIISFIVTAISGAVLNTLFFTIMFIVFFRNADILGMSLSTMSIIEVIGILVTLNAILEIIVCGIIGAAISKIIVKFVFNSKKLNTSESKSEN
ncbi:MAG: ECF transporter S component [Ruminococcaceae bacterium]|nr:ECF transporter S component [Oscillospiraceae bacterium]